jgi:nucleotide-binding universal stress UspA family protein
MFTRESGLFTLLVPLDGSRLAEAVLPTVSALASHYHGQVILLHVLEQRAPLRVHGERHLTAMNEAVGYLQEVADRLRGEGVAATYHVHENRASDVARGIAEHVQELGGDLVVMCAHGNGGVRDFLFGSIAQQVLQHGPRPVWLVQPRRDGSAPPFRLERILVPLDGTPAHEPALLPAIELAHAFAARLLLVFVIPTLATLAGEAALSGVMLPATMRAVLDLAEHGALDYLRKTVAFCRSQGVEAQGEVLRGDPVEAVLRLAEQREVQLMVLASHGRTGLDALLTGSVAPRIVARVGRMALPLLLVRADSDSRRTP